MRSKRDLRQNHAPRSAARPAKRDGSALLLVVATVVLLMLLGTSYLSLVRYHRRATAVETANHMDTVANATVSHIQTVLKKDVMDADGNFFNPASNTNSAGEETGLDEYRDYPWTNPDADPDDDGTPGRVVTDVDGNPLPNQAAGGAHDDTWLASSSPVFDTNLDGAVDGSDGAAFFPHLTQLGGTYLRLPKAGASDRQPVEAASTTNDTKWNADTNVELATGASNSLDYETADFHPIGVDADGDGIRDSKWMWAPLPRVEGRAYVMGVRIVDNSGMVNANTALTSAGLEGGNYVYDLDHGSGTTNDPALDISDWSNPAEIDVGRLVFELANENPAVAATDALAELRTTVNFRLPGALSTLPVPFGNNGPDSRRKLWENAGRRYSELRSGTVSIGGETYSFFPPGSETELRHRNGLNNAERTPAIESGADGMPQFLRAEQADNGTDDDGDGDVDGADIEADYTDVATDRADYFRNEPRHQMTVRSAASAFAPGLPGTGATNTPPGLTTDLNGPDNKVTPADASRYASVIRDVLTAGGGTFTPADWAPQFTNAADVADQLAVNMVDYADSDSTITEHNGHYGMEALPVITEVYAQARYEVTAKTFTAGTSNLDWQRQGNAGYVIEIRNPFRTPIDLAAATLKWVPTTGSATTVDSLDNLVSGGSTLGPDEVLLLYRHSNGNTEDEDDVTALIDSETDFNNVTEKTSFSWPSDDTATSPSYSAGFDGVTGDWVLLAEDQNGNDVPYCRAPGRAVPPSYEESVSGTAPSIADKDYYQSWDIGDGDGLNMLAVDATEFALDEKTPVFGTSTATRNTVGDQLGQHVKRDATGVSRQVTDPDSDINVRDDHQLVIANRGRFIQVGELAHIAMLGPNPGGTTQTVREVTNAAWTPPPPPPGPGPGDASDLTMAFATNNLLSSDNDGIDNDGDGTTDEAGENNRYSVPHAVLLVSRFTTTGPQEDGVDNDGDGSIDEPDEQVVLGRLNVNTAPAHLLDRVLPITRNDLRWEVVSSLVAYRDKLAPYDGANRGAGGANPLAIGDYRDAAGIATRGEAFEAVHRNDSTYVGVDALAAVDDRAGDGVDNDGDGTIDEPDEGDNRTMQNADGSAAEAVIDLINPSPDAKDQVIDDIEERHALARWISNVITTRSDVFTAYVTIRAYPAGDFRQGVVNSRRFIAIFDRSGLRSSDQNVRLIAFYEYR